MNIKAYRIQKGIQGKAIVRVLQDAGYRRYDKAIQSKVESPEKYAVRLTDDAERIVLATFGPYEEAAPTQPTRKPVRRRLPCRLYLRISERDRARLDKALEYADGVTVQEYLYGLLRQRLDLLDRLKESRPEMAVSKAAREETIHQNHTPTSAALSMDWQGRR